MLQWALTFFHYRDHRRSAGFQSDCRHRDLDCTGSLRRLSHSRDRVTAHRPQTCHVNR